MIIHKQGRLQPQRVSRRNELVQSYKRQYENTKKNKYNVTEYNLKNESNQVQILLHTTLIQLSRIIEENNSTEIKKLPECVIQERGAMNNILYVAQKINDEGKSLYDYSQDDIQILINKKIMENISLINNIQDNKIINKELYTLWQEYKRLLKYYHNDILHSNKLSINYIDFVKQVESEKYTIENCVETFNQHTDEQMRLQRGSSLQPMQRYITTWFIPLVASLEHIFATFKQIENKLSNNNIKLPKFAKYVMMLKPSELAVIAIHETLNVILKENGKCNFMSVILEIGRIVNMEVIYRKLRENNRDHVISLKSGTSLLHRHILIQESKKQNTIDNNSISSIWDDKILITVGSFLVYLLIHTADISSVTNENFKRAFELYKRQSHSKRRSSNVADTVTTSDINSTVNSSDINSAVNTSNTNSTVNSSDTNSTVNTNNINSTVNTNNTNSTVNTNNGNNNTTNPHEDNDYKLTNILYNIFNVDEKRIKEDTFQRKELKNYLSVQTLRMCGIEMKTNNYLKNDIIFQKNDKCIQDINDIDDIFMSTILWQKPEKPAFQHILQPEEVDTTISSISSSPPSLSIPSSPNDTTGKTNNYKNKKRMNNRGTILQHPDVWTSLCNDIDLQRKISPKMLPMIIPPKPWISFYNGGYIAVETDLIRTRNQDNLRRSLQYTSGLDRLMKILTKLGSIPWRINMQILNIVEKLWLEGDGDCDLPKRKKVELPTQVKLDDTVILDKNNDKYNTTDEIEKRKKYFSTIYKNRSCIRKVLIENANNHSLNCDMELRIKQAHSLCDKEFYMPYNIDFRGRAYPIPPHQNHLSSDAIRSIMIFKSGKPLGERGQYWQYAHLASLFGVDKISFDERVEQMRSKLDLIKYTAKNPLKCTTSMIVNTNNNNDSNYNEKKNVPWWYTADSPFQALAVIIDIYKAETSNSPEKYISHIPVHQDGSCNGQQHYAALGRDHIGGSRVNLTPNNIPQDVYTHVLNEVKKQLQDDINKSLNNITNSEEITKNGEYATILLPQLTRKVVKQTVMTSVYGVTIIGARSQIHKQQKELSYIWEDEKQLHILSLYLAKKILNSISIIFIGAKNIMSYLQQCGKLITKSGQPISWISPIGQPITQPYREETFYTIDTYMQRVQFSFHSHVQPISLRRQCAAFPPNFVHSQDASHMMITAERCIENGITFTSVHDSYWTHACDIDKMNTILRESFIDMYSQPILENLHQSFIERFPNINFPSLPPYGTLNLEHIRDSKYFFS